MPSRKHFLAAGAAALALPRSARAAAPRALVAGYVPSTHFAPVFVAQDRGFFANAGATVSLTPIVAGQDALALLATGRLDFIAAGLSAAFFNGINDLARQQPPDREPGRAVEEDEGGVG